MPAPDFHPGDPLSAAALNAWAEAGEAARVAVDGSSGLVGSSLPSGAGVRRQSPKEGWFRVLPPASGYPSGSYKLVEQVDLPGGGFADGPWARPGFLTPGSATPPTDGSKVVRAWRGRASFFFEWGAC